MKTEMTKNVALTAVAVMILGMGFASLSFADTPEQPEEKRFGMHSQLTQEERAERREMMKGVQRSVVNTETGVVITITGDSLESIAKIQEHAEKKASRVKARGEKRGERGERGERGQKRGGE